MNPLKVNVYNFRDTTSYERRVVARVNYNENLGTVGVGRTLGLTKLRKTGEYVFIEGTQWEGEKDFAYIVNNEEAIEMIISKGKLELLNKFPELKVLKEKMRN